VLSWRLTGPGQLKEWVDAFGNHAHVLVVDHPHDEIRIHSAGEIELNDHAGPLSAEGERHPPELFLRPTRLTEADARVIEFARGCASDMADPRDRLDGLLEGIGGQMSFRSGAMPLAPSARGVIEQGGGASPDHAHLFIACARSLGVPARFVSGYRCTDLNDETAPLAAHAWAEAWVDGAGWLSYDLGHHSNETGGHVRLAIGLDHLDAAPVQGVRRTGPGQDIQIEIADAGQAQRVIQAQQQQQ
jgi:transglutaminase-like putative cysteine protease